MSTTREKLRALGLVASQVGIEDPAELAELITLGYRVRLRREEALRAAETLARILR